MNSLPAGAPSKALDKDLPSTYRVGADIGGTFTDIVLLADDGTCLTRKVLSTPDAYARGIVEGLTALLGPGTYSAGGCEEVVHGTTVATNAILEGKGATTALLTTRGFRDVLELRRLRVPMLYDLRFRPPAPMVERRLRLEVAERLGSDGVMIEPLDEQSVLRAVERLRAEGVQAVAVCLLHSYRNPQHEARVGEIVARELPNTFLSLSIDVLPEIREYERTSTTVINAYVGPVVRSYLQALVQQLREVGITGRLLIMQSNGGIMSASAAAVRPAQMVESGPAAGVIAAQAIGQRCGEPNLITFDMGGTTAKASIIEDGQVSLTTEYEVGAGISISSRLVKGGGHALKLPVLDIAEVGAGGGSIVWVDRGGALKVGPRSAGAAPGPACYGLGGTEPTVTDANLALGYLNPGSLAGGELTLRPERAEAALSGVARELGLDLLEAAFGVHAVVNANMMRAIKAVSTYRGRDPRLSALLAFGGNGPVHAAAIAMDLGIRRVLVPPAPGLFSAIGLLQARPEHHFVQTLVGKTDEVDLEALNATIRQLEDRARRVLAEEGYPGEDVDFGYAADLRYVGQAYEIAVQIAGAPVGVAERAAIAERFAEEHERVYGHHSPGEAVEFVNLRVIAHVSTNLAGPILPVALDRPQGERRAYFNGQLLPTPVLGRSDLGSAGRAGPLIVEDYDATTVVPPGCTARLDQWGCIVIETGAGA